jgi:hypothetical protein
MTMGRYVLLLLAPPGASWVASLQARLTTECSAAELIICASPEEACVRLGSGRLHSALLIDARARLDVGVASAASAAEAAGTPVFAVGSGPEALDKVAVTVPWGDRLPASVATLFGISTEAPDRHARLVGVCGPGGTGASLIARATAQGLADREDVLLADFALRARQALLHRVPDDAGALLDFISRQHGRQLSHDDIRGATVPIAGQRYRLLPGLCRRRHWVAVRPRVFDTALTALCSAFGLIIADITGDFEGEADTGSLEVEERNHMARRVAETADLVVVVSGAGCTLRHATGELVEELRALGVSERRMLFVTNGISSDRFGNETLALPEVLLQRDTTVPSDLVGPLRDAVTAGLLRLSSSGAPVVPMRPVAPGTLGSWEGSG